MQQLRQVNISEVKAQISKLEVKTKADEIQLKELLASLFNEEALATIAHVIKEYPEDEKFYKDDERSDEDDNNGSSQGSDYFEAEEDKSLPSLYLPYSIKKFHINKQPLYILILKKIGQGVNGIVKLGVELEFHEDKLILGNLTAVKTFKYQFRGQDILDKLRDHFKIEFENAKKFIKGKAESEITNSNDRYTKFSYTMAYRKGELPSLSERNLFERVIIAALATYRLKKLHDRKIMVRDLKPANMVYCHEKSKMYFVDVGGFSEFGSKKRELAGSYYFLPASFITNNCVYQPENDIYALGVSIAVIISGDLGNKLLAARNSVYDKKYSYQENVIRTAKEDLDWGILIQLFQESGLQDKEYENLLQLLKKMVADDNTKKPEFSVIITELMNCAIKVYLKEYKKKYQQVINSLWGEINYSLPLKALKQLEKENVAIPTILQPFVAFRNQLSETPTKKFIKAAIEYLAQHNSKEKLASRAIFNDLIKNDVNKIRAYFASETANVLKKQLAIEHYFQVESHHLIKLKEFAKKFENVFSAPAFISVTMLISHNLSSLYTEIINKDLNQWLNSAVTEKAVALNDVTLLMNSFNGNTSCNPQKLVAEIEFYFKLLTSPKKDIKKLISLIQPSRFTYSQLATEDKIRFNINDLLKKVTADCLREDFELPQENILDCVKENLASTRLCVALYIKEFPKHDKVQAAIIDYLKLLNKKSNKLTSSDSEKASQIVVQCRNLQQVILTLINEDISDNEKKKAIKGFKNSVKQSHHNSETTNIVLKIVAYMLSAFTLFIAAPFLHSFFSNQDKKAQQKMEPFLNVVQSFKIGRP